MDIAQLKNTKIFYYRETPDAAVGLPILFIQGLGAAYTGWLPQLQYFAERHDVVSYDHRGVGESDAFRGSFSIQDLADDARDLMNHLGWDKAHIVGHSMGGLIAQQLALSHPDRVQSLSLLCTFSCGDDAVRLTLKMLWLGIRSRIGTRRMRRHAVLQMLLSQSLFRRGDLDILAKKYGEYMGHDLGYRPTILASQIRAMSNHNIYEELPHLASIPTLVVSASEDPVALPEYGKKLASKIPGARYEEIKNSSHGVTIEYADLVNRHLDTFLKQERR